MYFLRLIALKNIRVRENIADVSGSKNQFQSLSPSVPSSPCKHTPAITHAKKPPHAKHHRAPPHAKAQRREDFFERQGRRLFDYLLVINIIVFLVFNHVISCDFNSLGLLKSVTMWRFGAKTPFFVTFWPFVLRYSSNFVASNE